MGLAYGVLWNGSVHQAWGSSINLMCGERDKGSGRAPLVNPRGPARKSVLRTTLTSRVPDYGRLDSTCSPVPGLAPCLGSPLSAIHGVQTLSCPLRFADFSGDTTPSLSYCREKPHRCCCMLVLVGRIRRSRHPAMGAGRQCRMALALIRPTRFQNDHTGSLCSSSCTGQRRKITTAHTSAAIAGTAPA